MVSTRSTTEIYLIGHPTEDLCYDVLPTTLDVVKNYFYHHTIKGLSQKDSLKIVAHEIHSIWSQVDIPICAEKNVVRKLHAVVMRYRDLGRSKQRGGPSQRKHEASFVKSTSELFDISKRNASDLMNNDNDKLFLQDQRTSRKFTITVLKKVRLQEDQEKIDEFRRAKDKYNEIMSNEKKIDDDETVDTLTTALSQLTSSDGSCLSQTTLNENDTPCSQELTYERQQKRIKITSEVPIYSEEVAMALDRANLSNAKAVHVLAAVAKTSGETTLDNVRLSVSTVRRVRNLYRSQHAVANKAACTFEGPLVLHFDGKLLPSLDGCSTKEERIAVVVSGDKIEKLLGVPKIGSGKAKLIAEACFSSITDWDLKEKIVGMSFDTTAANTGLKNGACALLEQKLEKELIWLPCRHHILEVVCRNVFIAVFGSTDGPNVRMFKRFKDFWPDVDERKYHPCSDGRLNDTLKELKENAVSFMLTVLNQAPEKLPRDDYRELLELALIFLGETPPRGVKFRAPGAFHHARWMSKLLYVFKIYVFRQQFELTISENSSCLEFGLFAALIYMKSWITCPNVIDAPYNDLQLIQNIITYESTSETISAAALKAFNRHLWYLGEELVAVSIFSESVSYQTKNDIVRLLKRNWREESDRRCLKYAKNVNLRCKTLDFFIGPASQFIFRVLG